MARRHHGCSERIDKARSQRARSLELRAATSLARLWRKQGQCAEAAGKVAVDVEAIGCDLLSMSAHKIYAPKGVGALYVRRGVRLHAENIGGRQERSVRGGTESVPNIVSFGAACELAAESLVEDAARLGVMRDRLESGVFERIEGVMRNGDEERSPFEYHEHLIPRDRGRGAVDQSRHAGRGRVDRFGMLIRFARTVAGDPRCSDATTRWPAERSASVSDASTSPTRSTVCLRCCLLQSRISDALLPRPQPRSDAGRTKNGWKCFTEVLPFRQRSQSPRRRGPDPGGRFPGRRLSVHPRSLRGI